MSSYILVVITAIYNFVLSNIFRKQRLDNKQASTRMFISLISELNLCLHQPWACSDRSNTE